jgi:hypothetical protein
MYGIPFDGFCLLTVIGVDFLARARGESPETRDSEAVRVVVGEGWQAEWCRAPLAFFFQRNQRSAAASTRNRIEKLRAQRLLPQHAGKLIAYLKEFLARGRRYCRNNL